MRACGSGGVWTHIRVGHKLCVRVCRIYVRTHLRHFRYLKYFIFSPFSSNWDLERQRLSLPLAVSAANARSVSRRGVKTNAASTS